MNNASQSSPIALPSPHTPRFPEPPPRPPDAAPADAAGLALRPSAASATPRGRSSCPKQKCFRRHEPQKDNLHVPHDAGLPSLTLHLKQRNDGEDRVRPGGREGGREGARGEEGYTRLKKKEKKTLRVHERRLSCVLVLKQNTCLWYGHFARTP